MRRLVLAVALAGCRQVLGIPDNGEVGTVDTGPQFDVTIVAQGVAGASAPVTLDVTRSDGKLEHVQLTRDGNHIVQVPDGLGYTVSGPAICTIDHGVGTILGAPAPQSVDVTCDGIAAISDPGFSAPATLAFAPGGSTFEVKGSFIVQETGLWPTPASDGAAITVALDGTAATSTPFGMWGPFPFVAGSTLAVSSSYAPFARAYTFTMTDAPPALFGYGKPETPIAGARFGSALGADGTLLVVGAPGPADGGAPGHAYVFRRTGVRWSQDAVLSAPVPAAGDNFGASVAVRDGRVVIGAPASGSVPGAVYVFQQTAQTWTGTPVVAPAGDRYGLGTAVVIDTDHILVGAPRTASAAGAVYQFALDGTAPQTFATGTDPGDQLGASIAIAGGTVVIGAPGEASSSTSPANNDYPAAGAAYLYTGGAGSTPTYLKAPSPAPGDRFGAAVATNGTVLVVGAPDEDSSASFSTGIDPMQLVAQGAPESGAAYMWRRQSASWTFAHTLKAPGVGTGDGFGSALALVRDVLAIGAPFEDSASLALATADDSRTDAGAVYAYHVVLDDVTEMPAYVKAATPGVDDAFGSAVELSLESLVVGAPYDSSFATGWNGPGGDYDADTGAVSTYR